MKDRLGDALYYLLLIYLIVALVVITTYGVIKIGGLLHG